jgi:serine protease
MRIKSLLLLLSLSITIFGNIGIDDPKYLPNTIILKVKSEHAAYCTEQSITHPEILKLFNSIGLESIAKQHPGQVSPVKTHNEMGIKLADLSLIYHFKYTSAEDPKLIGSKMMGSGFFEYSEPFYLHKTLFNPDDPLISSQYHLTNCKAYEAWDHAQGDTNIVIGITDTGIELAHGDMSGNIKYNYADPINGIDDDGDGYIDNFYGWNTGDNNNDPSTDESISKHGQTVAGCAGASTNNATQIAGVGYKSKILPVKISNISGYLTGTYTGIVYAADHGANIINCSWGSVNSWSQYGQDVVTYAAINNTCLVVCAAGNDNNEGIFYPASFDFAMSVAASNISDLKWNYLSNKGSNYNEHVDISAPGHDIYTLTTIANGGTIGGRAGTSMSAPIVSGGAAIAWSKYKTYTGIQVGELLKATADSMEFIPGNAAYTGKLGEGRLNMERSVTETGFPGLYMYNFSFLGNNQNKLVPGDTVGMSGNILNFLDASSAGTKARVTSTSPYIKMVDSILTIGAIPALGNLDITPTPFKFVVLPGMPASEIAEFVVTMTDGTYNSKRYTEQSFNVDYVDVTVNKLGTSVGSSGKLAYNKLQVQAEGLGVTYNGSASMIYQMGLMVTDNSSQVSYILDGDFDTQTVMSIVDPGSESDYDVHTHYNDQPADSSLDISIEQNTLAWTETKREKFVLVECQIFNNSAVPYTNLHVGVYADWDIGVYSNNEAQYDPVTNTAYTYEVGGTFGGIHLLDNSTLQHYAYNNDGTGGSVSIYDGYDKTEQFTHLTSGNSRAASDITDVSSLIGNGPFTLAAGDSMIFTFAILVGDSLLDIQQSALEADSAYNEIRAVDISLSSSTDPLCNGNCDGTITIVATGGVGAYTYLWNDPLAQTTAAASALCSGTYQCIVTDSLGTSNTITGIALTDPASFPVSLGNDTSLCGGDSLQLDAGNPGENYLWSTLETSQQIYVSAAGQYIVKVTNVAACTASDTIIIYASSSPVVDLGNDTAACSGNSVTFDAANTGLNFLWSNGAASQAQAFSTSGTYWVLVTNFSNCTARDSVVLTVSTLTSVNIGLDVNACDTYSGTLDAGNVGMTYLWSTGGTGQTIAISSAGTYFVEVKDGATCGISDTMTLTIEPTPNINFGADTAICKSSNFILDAGVGSSYLWNNGLTTQTVPTYTEGEYMVTVGTNCNQKDTINISFLDDPTVWYNSSFETARHSTVGDVVLTFGEPLGGIYSGPGVTGNIFNTIVAGDGLHKIDYTFTDSITGCSASAWVTMDVNSSVSVFGLHNDELTIYPNPFNNYINIEFGNSTKIKKVSFNLYDNRGKLVVSKFIGDGSNNENYNINTYGLSPGVYHLVVSGDEFYRDIKLIK